MKLQIFNDKEIPKVDSNYKLFSSNQLGLCS